MTECPYGDLYIYYLNGSIRKEPEFGPDFIGNWEEDGFSFLFFHRPADRQVKSLIEEVPGLSLIDQYMMTYDEWLGEKPGTIAIGRFTVSPPWDRPDPFYLPSFGAWHILLDPGVVFGTGTHPTTRDCLEFMEKTVRNGSVERVLDLGCGTGLLSLAAAKLRCGKILALDFNALAVRTTRRNIILNGLEDRILAVQGLAEDLTAVPADLLVANIHFDVMKKIIRSPGFTDHRQFILSGLLKSQAEEVERMLSDLPLRIVGKRVTGGVWSTFFATKDL
jgi:ribosomal protein L11 methyltransferase